MLDRIASDKICKWDFKGTPNSILRSTCLYESKRRATFAIALDTRFDIFSNFERYHGGLTMSKPISTSLCKWITSDNGEH